jgi:hypothetical protein
MTIVLHLFTNLTVKKSRLLMFNSYYFRLLTIAFGETEKMERLIKLIINLKKKFSTMLYELLSKKNATSQAVAST